MRAVLQFLCGFWNHTGSGFWLSDVCQGLVLSINLPSGAKQQLGVHFSAKQVLRVTDEELGGNLSCKCGERIARGWLCRPEGGCGKWL